MKYFLSYDGDSIEVTPKQFEKTHERWMNNGVLNQIIVEDDAIYIVTDSREEWFYHDKDFCKMIKEIEKYMKKKDLDFWSLSDIISSVVDMEVE